MLAGSACPNTVQEYLPSNQSFTKSAIYNARSRYREQESGRCTWHRTENGRTVTVYPEEYRRWFANITRHGSIGQPHNTLTLIRPANGSHFVSNPRYRGTGVPIEITGGTEDTVHIIYDNRLPIILNRPFLGTLSLEKGEHRLVVRCGDEEVSVVFTVE